MVVLQLNVPPHDPNRLYSPCYTEISCFHTRNPTRRYITSCSSVISPPPNPQTQTAALRLALILPSAGLCLSEEPSTRSQKNPPPVRGTLHPSEEPSTRQRNPPPVKLEAKKDGELEQLLGSARVLLPLKHSRHACLLLLLLLHLLLPPDAVGDGVDEFRAMLPPLIASALETPPSKRFPSQDGCRATSWAAGGGGAAQPVSGRNRQYGGAQSADFTSFMSHDWRVSAL